MTRCKGLHCPGCKNSRQDLAVIVAMVLVLIIVADSGPIVRAVAELVEIVAISAAVVVVLGVAVVVTVWRVRRKRALGARRVAPLVTAVRSPAELPDRSPARPAIEPPRAYVPAHLRINAQPHVVTRPVVRSRCAHREEGRS